MVVTGAMTAAFLMAWFFSRVSGSYTREACITGACWLAMNWALDLLVLVGLMGMAPADYLSGIGLRYLIIPVMVITTGVVAERALQQHISS